MSVAIVCVCVSYLTLSFNAPRNDNLNTVRFDIYFVILYTYLYQCERIFFFLYRLSYIYKSLILFNA